ncbi:hypothetical protein [Rhodoferax sp. TS-BS-61-7]|uniref:hypothetical protein n=1 Tax=Rhodoferax sp. TS-BS-61-7 TaxID=2094194 RepID=UPI0011AFE6EF|nr:hypothetical protein [Rhodoferax sp. TS-BS-61-7]
MTHTPAEVDEWTQELLDEALRDLVFLWNIRKGDFSELHRPPDEETIEAVLSGLVRGGCVVGFGDPGTSSWTVPSELKVSRENLPQAVLNFCMKNPSGDEFLVFTRR